MTAYVDLTKSPPPNTERLVAPGRREGYPLYVLNPDFYDDRLAPTKTQSVVIAYWYGKHTCADYMKKNVKQIYDDIDYKAIKESLK